MCETIITPEIFTKTETRLKVAIAKVEAKLAYLKAENEKSVKPWGPAEEEKFKDWNLLHDLQDRLESRLWDNYSAFSDWHFEKMGWVAY